MPMRRGSSDTIISANIREFHRGATYRRTKRRSGKARADKQAVAAAMASARKTIAGSRMK